ncbi:MAG: hypothetical protein EOM76_03280 [Sphingobacteriia bacterium]|nr:hypothetical protein [Sphingobacteriia bacterium]
MFSARLKICIILCICLFCGCSKLKEPEVPIQFSELASLPVGRASASAFVVEGKAYVLYGRGADGVVLNDMWQYDINANVWVQQNDLPFKGRVKAIAQVVDNVAYVGLGYVGEVYRDSCYLRDFWKYTPATNMWTRCADFPSHSSDAAVSFSVNKNIYVAFGFFDGFTTEVYKYNTDVNVWIQCDEAKIPARGGAVGCSDGFECFAGTGYNTTSLNDWWRYLPQSDKWQRLADIPGKGREFASAIAVGQRIYLLGGRHFGGTLTTGFLFDDLLEYDVSEDRWLLLGHLPNGGRENMITFSVDGKGYFGLGEDKDGKIFKDLYRWDD